MALDGSRSLLVQAATCSSARTGAGTAAEVLVVAKVDQQQWQVARGSVCVAADAALVADVVSGVAVRAGDPAGWRRSQAAVAVVVDGQTYLGNPVVLSAEPLAGSALLEALGRAAINDICVGQQWSPDVRDVCRWGLDRVEAKL
ncbi:hypothetical protein [Flexivirga meconopsidis]|uniref:hypothetical protein n=1 Tax=Flexivirga meconopsidis TaxID=2977121 RepID=UPI0022409DCB|nr:hypothetical protein [Flexivirga meconopsidis]